MRNQRTLHLAAYDISNAHRLHHALKIVKRYATGGQKSVYECFLTDSEVSALLSDIYSVLDEREDRFFLIRLDNRIRVKTMGIADKPADPAFFYIG